MTRALFPALLLAAFLAPRAAEAATIDEVKAEIKVDKKNLKDDKKDLKAIQKIRKKWEKARAKGSATQENKADISLAEWVKEELAESRREIGDAADEVESSGDSAAPRTYSKPTASGSNPSMKPSARGPSARQTDDQEDLEAERTAQRRLRRIAEDLKEWQPKFSNGTAGDALYEKKSDAIAELQRMAGRELDRTEKELVEDQRQLDRLKGK